MEKLTKILIVDDIEDNRLVIKSSLRTLEGIEIFEARNGAEAIKLMQENKADIVLMDVLMPVMDGFEATAIIKEYYPEVPVIVITALKDSQTEEKMLSVGASAYLKKPIDRKLLRYKISTFIKMLTSKDAERVHKAKHSGINPFNQNVRCFKTYFMIADEENLMDFGTWILDAYSQRHAAGTFRFDDILDAIYSYMHLLLKKGEMTQIVLEEDFEYLYICIDARKIETNNAKILEEIADDCIQKEGFVYFRISLTQKERKPQQIKTEQKQEALQESDVKILRKSSTDHLVSAKEYMEEFEGEIPDQVYDLKEIFGEWQLALEDFKESGDAASFSRLLEHISSVSSILNQLYDFMSLGYAMAYLTSMLGRMDVSAFDSQKKKTLSVMLKTIEDDLQSWWKSVFVTKEAQNIYYLDSSLYSSCLQLEMLLENKNFVEESDDDEGLELF